MKISKNEVGISGEFYIAYILAKHGFKVNVSLGRTEGFDLFVQNPKGRNITVSVKTTYLSSAKSILIGKKSEQLIDDNLYYAIVRLNEPDGIPEYWIIPSKIVAEVIKKSHEIWLETPGRDGKAHKDSSMRKLFLVSHGHYPEDWEEQLKNYKSKVKTLEEL